MKSLASNPFSLIGGNYYLNWRNHAFFAVLALFSAVLFDHGRLDGRPSDWFWFGLFGIAITVIPLELLRPLLKKAKSNRSLLVLLLLLAVGLFRGTILFLVGLSIGLLPEEDFLYRIVGAPLFVFFSYLISSSIFEPYLDFKRQSQILRDETIRLQQAKSSYSHDLLAFNQQQRVRVRELLSPPIWELQKRLEEAENTEAIREALMKMQALNNEVVRPLSHELVAQEPQVGESDIPRSPGVSQHWPKRIALGQNLPFRFFLLVSAPLAFNSQITLSDSVSGLFVAIFTLSPMAIFFLIERKVFQKKVFAYTFRNSVFCGTGVCFWSRRSHACNVGWLRCGGELRIVRGNLFSSH